jgi:hypothetical protein
MALHYGKGERQAPVDIKSALALSGYYFTGFHSQEVLPDVFAVPAPVRCSPPWFVACSGDAGHRRARVPGRHGGQGCPADARCKGARQTRGARGCPAGTAGKGARQARRARVPGRHARRWRASPLHATWEKASRSGRKNLRDDSWTWVMSEVSF